MDSFDLCIIGAGVIGVALAERISALRPASFSLLLVERNERCGQETSARNSEVIHAGIYYPQGSLKARLCVEGKQAIYDYCHRFGIAHRRLGKFILAQKGEQEILEQIIAMAQGNGVSDLVRVSKRELQRAEPSVCGEEALFSPSTGIVDSHGLIESLLHQAQSRGVVYAPRTQVVKIEAQAQGFALTALCGQEQEVYRFQCTRVINAAGLWARDVAAAIDQMPLARLPHLGLLKGNYFRLNARAPFRHLIYPVPDPLRRNLGIHATLDLGGNVRFGPDVEAISEIDYSVNPERKEAFVRAIAPYFPSVNEAQLVPDYAGIRPRLLSESGQPLDFVIQDAGEHGLSGLINLFGIESPGLTASLALAEELARHPEMH